MSAIAWGRIGPNAIIRVDEALPAVVGREEALSLFTRAGMADWFRQPPADMVDEQQVARLGIKRGDVPQGLAAVFLPAVGGDQRGSFGDADIEGQGDALRSEAVEEGADQVGLLDT